MSVALGQVEAGWQKTHEESGITVSTRTAPGAANATFRGQGNVKGGLLHLLAILLDDARSKEWAKGVSDAKVLRTIDERTAVVYSRSAQPWPVRDRDVVLKRTVDVLKPGLVRVRLVCAPSERPPSSAAVRIEHCETVILLRKVDEQTTYVDYQVTADPGGPTPSWIVRWASKNIPLDTLHGLRKQVKKTAGQYRDVEATWTSAL